MRHLLSVLFTVFFHPAVAQWSEDFSDGDFIAAPPWSGDTAVFAVNADGELQLDATDPGTSLLAAAVPLPDFSHDSMEWRFSIRLTFSPSSANYSRVYLVSDRVDFSGNGYFLQFGESLSNDAVELFRQDSNQVITSVCRGQDGQIASAFSLGVKVTRDVYGVWRLYLDPSGGNNYQFSSMGAEGSHTGSAWTGVRCTYTSANATRFYFDDFYVGPPMDDSLEQWVVPEGGVLFNEIYFEPSGTALIPSVEFVELANRTADTVRTEGWRITDGATEARLPLRSCIPPFSLVVICASPYSALFPAGCPVIQTSAFPSLNNDTGDELVLLSKNGRRIDRVAFNDDSYRDENKSGGGWTIERIDTAFCCTDPKNWRASVHPSGGTPGESNSVSGRYLDTESPWIASAWQEDDYRIRLLFSEPVKGVKISALSITDATGHPFSSSAVDSVDAVTFEVVFTSPIPGMLLIHPVDGLTDCPGNSADTAHIVRITYGVSPMAGDLAVNELLFDVPDEGADFIELINRSGKVIDLKDVSVQETDFEFRAGTGLPVRLTDDHLLLFPGELRVWSEDTDWLRTSYVRYEKHRAVHVNELPDFNSDEGGVLLFSPSGDTIERMCYSSAWHYPLLTDTKGVSLERIRSSTSSSDRTTWHSAASDEGYATPGAVNSQHVEAEQGSGEVELVSRIFSPDNDGQNDVLTIEYRFPDPGRLVQAFVFRESGRMVCQTLRTSLAGTSGEFVWDGNDETGQPVPEGRYIVFVETVSLSGAVNRYKRACGVAYRR
ncbi:MAG: hypothetical protein RL021_506 [Bacteroidota bacterium]|jgi:hypothetical protein